MSPSTPLIETKLHPPRPRKGVVARGRLEARLDATDLPPVVLVSAAAGFGKTTLLARWLPALERAGVAAAWVSLDRRDGDPAVFWSYVLAAVGRAAPGAEEAALAALEAAPAQLDAVVGALVNALAAHPREVALVLDDHHLVESIEVHESMMLLVEHLPPTAHLVVGTRADPPWPLGRLRARGELVEVRAADLRFTDEEAAAYLNGAMGLDLAEDDLAVLGARTEGWVAALQLAALSLQGRPDPAAFIAAFAGDDRFVVDYLVDEVLDRQPAEVGRFLLDTAILDRLTGPLCDAVTGLDGGAAMLERLDRSNLFVVPLDDRRAWYRYHHLFADVLRARLQAEGPARAGVLHGRASDWFDGHGDAASAIGHALTGGHVERAAELIETAAPRLRQDRQEGTLRRWLEALPETVFVDRPVLAIGLVGARMATGDTTGVEDLLQLIDAALDPSAPPPVVHDRAMFDQLPAQVLVQRAGLALLSGDLAATAAHATGALDLVATDDHFRRGAGHALLALAHWSAGDLASAEDRYTQAVAAFVAADHLPDALGCSLSLADVHLAQGHLGAAVRTFEAGLRLTVEHPGLRGAADMHVGLSEVLVERDDLDGAAAHLDTSALLGDAAGLPQYAYRWRVTAARLARARGDVTAALALVDEAAPHDDTDFSPPVRPVAAVRARLLVAAGRLDEAVAWVAASGVTTADALTYVREYEHLTLSRVLIAQGALPQARTLLERLLAAAVEGSRTGSAVEVLVLLAAVHLATGDHEAARAALDEALARAEPEGHVRLFLHAGPAVTTLLGQVASRPDATPHAQRVLAAATGHAPTAPPASPLVDELSPRERDVLRMLRTELTGPEIAAEMFVSLNTVRTHTKAIFSKLGVGNRRAAVRRADELGL